MKAHGTCKLDLARSSVSRREALGTFIFALFLFSLITTAPNCADAQEATNKAAPVFNFVSIKPDDSGIGMAKMMFESDGYNAENASLEMLIKDAYGVDDLQISGAPQWVFSQKYDIEATLDSRAVGEISKLTEDQRKLVHQRILQQFLSDRFKLTIHHETKDIPVYWLVSADDVSKLHVAKAGDDYSDGLKFRGDAIGPHRMLMQLGGGQITGIVGQGMPLADLVTQLSGRLGRKVMDKTGLTGNYNFNLQWTSDTSSIFPAIQEQLGLRLESKTGPVDILNIDHIEKPSEN